MECLLAAGERKANAPCEAKTAKAETRWAIANISVFEAREASWVLVRLSGSAMAFIEVLGATRVIWLAGCD